MSETNKGREKDKQVSARSWLLLLGFLSLVGIADSAYLSVLHWKVHNQPGHVSFCAVSEKVNCDTVALSTYSSVANVPVATWGMLFYAAMLVLVAWGWIARQRTWPWALLGLLNAMACAGSAFLFLVSELDINSYCIMCLILYGVNVFSAFACFMGAKKAGIGGTFAALLPLSAITLGVAVFMVNSPRALDRGWLEVALLGGICLLALMVLVLSKAYKGFGKWISSLKADFVMLLGSPVRGAVISGLVALALVATWSITAAIYPKPKVDIAGGTEGMSFGCDEDVRCWIGASKPQVTIVEFSDYECPFCRKAHDVVRTVVRKNKDWVRLVHMHMPLDNSCNPQVTRPFHHHSCSCSLAAICAAQQGSFWEMNDRLFLRRGGLDAGGLTILARNMGLDGDAFRKCMDSKEAREKLENDLEEARRLHLRPATPTFRIGNETMVGGKGVMDPNWWQKELEKLRP